MSNQTSSQSSNSPNEDRGQAPNPAPPPAPQLVTIRLADVQPEAVEWLWPARIPLGKLTILQGDPDLGKSLITLDIAARVSSGTPWPDDPGENPQGHVLLLSAEDDLADTVRPRLDAMSADVSRITAIQAVRPTSGTRRWFSLDKDVRALNDHLTRQPDCRLVVIDPITAYLNKTDGNSNTEVRNLLAPLVELASIHSIAIVAVTHLNKSDVQKALYRAMGSVAFVATARACWMVVPDRNDEQRRLLLPVKMNLTEHRSGLAYRIESRGERGAAAVQWESGSIAITANEALAAEEGPSSGGKKLPEAVGFLKGILADGPQRSTVVIGKGQEAGIKERTLERAKEKLGVDATSQSTESGQIERWLWSMPQEQQAGENGLPSDGGVDGVDSEATTPDRQDRQDLDHPSSQPTSSDEADEDSPLVEVAEQERDDA